MHWMNKLERKIGKYAIKHLIVYILVAYAIGYILQLFSPGLFSLLTMNPAAICHGQVWRLITWVCTPPEGLSIFTIFMFMLYYWIGKTLEDVWGAFRYNLYMFMGIFTAELVKPAMLLSRGLSFYFLLMMSAAVTFVAHFIVMRNDKKNALEEQQEVKKDFGKE